MNKITILALLFFTAAFAIACASRDTAESSTVQQTEIYQDYAAEWKDGRLRISAIFRFGGPTGTTLQLTPPSRVAYRGIGLMPAKVLLTGTVYQFEASAYPNDVGFEFYDTDGKSYVNSIELAPLEFGAVPANGQRSAPLVLPIGRMVNDPGTTVEVRLTDSAGAEHVSPVGQEHKPGGAKDAIHFDWKAVAIVIEPEYLKNIPAGSTKISLITGRKEKPAQATRLGGSIAIRYQSKPVTLALGN